MVPIEKHKKNILMFYKNDYSIFTKMNFNLKLYILFFYKKNYIFYR
jgi:hypothetical protein